MAYVINYLNICVYKYLHTELQCCKNKIKKILIEKQFSISKILNYKFLFSNKN